MPPKGPIETVPKEFRCAATGKPLYLPVITLKGVAYSYEALFEMFMSSSAQGGQTICKVTQEPIAFFPSVCVPLHHYMYKEFPNAMRSRQQQDAADMYEKFELKLPSVSDAPDLDGDDGFLEEFECAVSHELAYEPCCLSSGTIVSACFVPQGGFRKDPDRLVACSLHNQAPAKSEALESMMKAMFPKEYGQRASDLAKQGIDTSGEFANGTYKEDPRNDYIHWGYGCDACGLWPIVGKGWYDTVLEKAGDKVGFHLCDPCYAFKFHTRVITGKFGQERMPKNEMAEMHMYPM